VLAAPRHTAVRCANVVREFAQASPLRIACLPIGYRRVQIFKRKRWRSQRLDRQRYQKEGAVVTRHAVGFQRPAIAATVHQGPFAMGFDPNGDGRHESTTLGAPISGTAVDMHGPQAVGTVIAMAGTRCLSIGAAAAAPAYEMIMFHENGSKRARGLARDPRGLRQEPNGPNGNRRLFSQTRLGLKAGTSINDPRGKGIAARRSLPSRRRREKRWRCAAARGTGAGFT
jgi:hypothetical protein